MEGQDHDLLVRIDERVQQIHSCLGGYDTRIEDLEKRTGSLENNQAKAIGIASVLSFFVAIIGNFFLSLIRKL